MATYEEIYGKRVKEFDSDPTLDSSYEGQVWYDKSSGVLKSVVSAAAWASSASMVNGRPQCSGTGTQTAGLAAGTYPPAVGSYGGANQTEEYNGIGWSTGGDMSNGKADLNTFGTQTAAYAAGGDAHPTNPRGSTQVESYNGTSWTSAPALPQGSYEGGGSASNGTETSALVLGGRSGPPPSISDVTQTWNGSAWGTGGTYPSPVQGSFVFGSSNPTMISAGGYVNATAVQANAFSYDGSNWTAINSMQDGRYVGVGSGTNTSGLLYGGASGSPDTRRQTETFDGTTFTVGVLMATPRNSMAGSKISGTTAFAASTPGVTEEYQVSINTLTPAAWSSGGNLNTGRSNLGATGPKSAGLAIQGETSTDVNNVEEYDGSSWTNATAHPESKQSASVAGLQTAAISLGGYPLVTTSVSYDGTNWTAAPALTVANANWAAGGPSTACFGIGGGEVLPAPNSGKYHDEYDGSSWTSATLMSTTRVQCASLGAAQDAILATGGRANSPGAPSTRISSTESWNGSSWTAGPSMLQARSGHLAFGTQTAGIIQAGSTNPGSTTLTSQNRYDGTVFATGPTNSVNHGGLGGTGGTTAPVAASVSNCFMCGGPGQNQATEEFTDESEAIDPVTLTTS